MFVVVDHEDAFRAGLYGLRWDDLFGSIGLLLGFGQVKRNCGADAGRAVDVDMSAGLPDKAVNRAETKPGPLTDVLGGKKGLKDAAYHRRQYAAPEVEYENIEAHQSCWRAPCTTQFFTKSEKLSDSDR